MKLADSLVLLGVAALPLAAPWMDEAGATARPAVMVVGQDATAQDGAAADKKEKTEQKDKPSKEQQEVRELIARLGSSEAKVRHEAYEALAKKGEKARAALEEARKSDDAETRFSAAQLLDRLEREAAARGRSGWLRELPLRPGEQEGDEDAQPREMLRFHRLFDDTRLRELHERMTQRMRELFDGEDPFAEVLRDGRLGLRGGGLQMGPGSSFSMVRDVDGRRESVEVKVDQDGRAQAVVEKDGQKATYEAESFEKLKAEHPDLFEGLGATSFSVRVPRAVQLPPIDAPRRELRIERDAAQADGPRLGIRVEPVDPKVAEYLELEEGVGLRVVEVVAGSAAEHLGVRKNDIVLEVNGRAIRGVADVQAALGKGDPKQADVTVLRRGQKRDL